MFIYRLIILCLFLLGTFSSFAQTNQEDAPLTIGLQEEALVLLYQEYNSDTSNYLLLEELAQLEYGRGNFKNAKQHLHHILNTGGDSIAAIKKLATIYELEENAGRAIKYNLLLINLYPDNGVYYRKVAQQYRTAGEPTGALSYYNQAFEKNNVDFFTIKGLSEILLDMDMTEQADTILSKALEQDSTNIAYNLLAARTKYKLKDYKNTYLTLHNIRGIYDFSNYYCKMMGYSLMQIDSVEKAIYWLERSLVNEGNPEAAHYYLSEAYDTKQEDETAIFHLKKAIKAGTSDNLAKYHRNLAKKYDEQKNLKAAIPHYEEAYKYGKDPRMLFFLARAYDAYYEDKSVAIRYYSRYMNSDDNVEEYKSYARDRRIFLKEMNHLSKVSNN